MRRRVVTVVMLAVGAILVGYFLRQYYFGFVKEVVTTVVPFFFTPFILEATTFLLGLTLVFVWNNYHRKKDEEDEWVYLAQVEPELVGEAIPEPLRRRAGETKFRESEHPGLDAAASGVIGRIEGLLDFGLCEEATEELMELSESAGESHPEVLRLRHALCGKTKGTEAARRLAEEWIARGIVGADVVAGWTS